MLQENISVEQHDRLEQVILDFIAFEESNP